MFKNQLLQDKTIESKGQKIAAALYLVTNHLSEFDPLRTELRELGVSLLQAGSDERTVIGRAITSLLNVGLIARVMSENNVKILEAEIRYFTDPLYRADTTISSLFPAPEADKGQFLFKRTEQKETSFIPKYERQNITDSKIITKENKTKRQEQILSFINEKKSVNVKDIASLFPAVSEKTIQRELGALVADGKISRRGDKRWSVYMAIQK